MSLFALTDDQLTVIITNGFQTLVILASMVLAVLGYKKVNGWSKPPCRRSRKPGRRTTDKRPRK